MLKIGRAEKSGEICFDLTGELDMHTGEVLDNLLQKENVTNIKNLFFL